MKNTLNIILRNSHVAEAIFRVRAHLTQYNHQIYIIALCQVKIFGNNAHLHLGIFPTIMSC